MDGENVLRIGYRATILIGYFQVFPSSRNASSRPIGPGVMMREDISERKRRSGEELDAYTALE